MRVRWIVAAAMFGFGVILSGCDQGAVVLAENQTDLQLLARATGIDDTSETSDRAREMVSIMAPNSKLVVGEIPFSGGFRVNRVEILRDDCTVIDTVDIFAGQGTYIVVDDDIKVTLRKEYPQNGVRAETTERCRLTPMPSPSPLRTARPIPSASG